LIYSNNHSEQNLYL